MHAEQRGRRIAGKQHLPLRVVPRDEIAETLCDQPVLLGDLQVLAMAQVEFTNCEETEAPGRSQKAEVLGQSIAPLRARHPAESEQDRRGDAPGHGQRETPADIGRLDDEDRQDGENWRAERTLCCGDPAGGRQEACDRENHGRGEPACAGGDQAGHRLRRAAKNGDAGHEAEISGEGQHDWHGGETERAHCQPGGDEPLVPGVELRVGCSQRMNECTNVPRYRCPGLFAAHVRHSARGLAHPF